MLFRSEVAAAPADAATRPGSGVLGGRPPSMPSHDVDATGPTVASLQRKQPSNDDLTMVGAALGTPGYSALELMDGLEADGRADVFSLGVVLYELLTAARPFSGATWGDVRNEVAAERYRRAREHVPSLSSELDAVIEQALRANRDVRTPSVGALVAALAHASAAPRRRRRALMVIGAAAAVSGGAWGLLRYTGKARTSTAPIADAAVAVPGPDLADASTDDGDASAVDALAPVQLTRTDGCAYAPAFLDEDRLAFDLTLPGTAPDIHVHSLAGGATSQLTREPTDEWRAGPGLTADELIYLVTDRANPTRSSLVARDLSTGAQRELAPRAIAAAAAARGAYYFVPASGTELRRMRNKIDEQVARLPGMSPQSLTTSPDDRWLALVGPTPSQASDVCLFDLERRALRCANRTDALAGRADFGAGGALYYGASDGIHARLPADGPATADRLVIPSVLAHGGLAIAPGGRTLVYSECLARSVLRDVGATPAVSLTDDDQVASPAAGPGGRIAWVNAGGELSVRFPDGEIERVTGRSTRGDSVIDPAFDAAGETLVFARTGQDAGIATAALHKGAVAATLTRQPGDRAPLFLGDGSIVFTRLHGTTPWVYRIVAGADPARARPTPRRTVAVDRATGRVLLRSPDSPGQLFWWDPVNDTEIPGPPATPPGVATVTDISLSPDGAWLLYQGGPGGRELWRAATRSLEVAQVHVAPSGSTVSHSAITDDGHALIAEVSWRGELWRLDAAATPW